MKTFMKLNEYKKVLFGQYFKQVNMKSYQYCLEKKF